MRILTLLMVMVSSWCGCRSATPSANLYVIDGAQVAPKDYPAALTLVQTNGGRCGGGIVGPNVVITAAHCLSNMEDGGVTAEYYNEDGHLKLLSSLHVTVHPNLREAIEEADSKDSERQVGINVFFNRFAGQAQVKDKSGGYEAIAVNHYEFRGPEGKAIGTLDFAVVVFPGTPFHLHYPILTSTPPPEEVYFVGRGVFTDDLERIDRREARRGESVLAKGEDSVFITTSNPADDGKPDWPNSSAAIGDSGIPLWAKLAEQESNELPVTLAVHSSSGYWLEGTDKKRTYYGRFSALPPGATDFMRENVWISAMSKTSLSVLRAAIQHPDHPAQILFYPTPPRLTKP